MLCTVITRRYKNSSEIGYLWSWSPDVNSHFLGPFSKSMNFVADVDLAGAASLLHKSRRTDRKNTDKQYPELTKLALTYSTSTPAHPHTNAQKSVP